VKINTNWNDSTVRDLYAKRHIDETSEGWTEKHAEIVAGMKPCVHKLIAASVVYRCIDCGAVTSDQINQGLGKYLVQVRQGLIPAQSVIEDVDLDYNMQQLVRSITVCAHTTKSSYNCSGGGNRLSCVDCGRTFTAEESTND
jgi:DNA-directed RNA polymerase subunit RPC12/RpoP